jgi:putative transposase
MVTTSEALCIDIELSLTAERLIGTLNRVLLVRGKPERIRLDHGPEFTSDAFGQWAVDKDINLDFTQPGKPTQNAFIERFNGTYRREVLNAWLFISLVHAREETEQWLEDYHTIRPHDSLGKISPVEFLTHRGYAELSSF